MEFQGDSYLLLLALVTSSLFTRRTAGVGSSISVVLLFLAVVRAGVGLKAIGQLAQLPFLSPPSALIRLALGTSVVVTLGSRA